MRQLMTLLPKQRALLNEIETKLKDARNSNDYIQINFGRRGEFIKVAFHRDNTYTIGYNFYNMEFLIKTNILIKQYPRTVNAKMSAWLFDWVNRLNR